MYLEEKTLEEHVVFDGRIIKVQRDIIELDGKQSVREVVKHGGGVCVLALDDNDEIYFVRQFRYPYKEAILEIPAGKLEKGEDPFEAMKREQMEETGTYSENYLNLGEMYPTPGYCDEIIRIWACRISGECEMNLDEGEFLDIEKIKFEKALEMVSTGEIKDAKTQIAILKAQNLLNKGEL